MSDIASAKNWVIKVRQILDSYRQNKESEENYNDVSYVPYINNGDKWCRMYYEHEVESIKAEAYDMGFKDGISLCRFNKCNT